MGATFVCMYDAGLISDFFVEANRVGNLGAEKL